MMMGGGMLFGLLAMLLFLALPVVLIAGVVAAAAGLFARRPIYSAPVPPAQSAPAISDRPPAAATPPARYCAHCGQGLQSDWTHCPYCGAPAAV
jgi:hypothetical protein